MSRKLTYTDADINVLFETFKQKVMAYQGSSKQITIPTSEINAVLHNTAKAKQNVFISPTAWAKMQHLVMYTEKEIAWHCLVKRIKKDTFYIYDILVYPQEVTGTTVNTDDTKYTLWRQELPTDVVTYLKGQGHSHVNMGVNPSGTDTSYYEDIINSLRADAYYVFLILNKKGDVHCQIADKKTNTLYTNNDCIVQVYTKQKEKLGDWVDATINKYVKSTPKYFAKTQNIKPNYNSAHQSKSNPAEGAQTVRNLPYGYGAFDVQDDFFGRHGFLD